jgi:putative two-component system hydrogenase maturation factor HypX/HoxX
VPEPGSPGRCLCVPMHALMQQADRAIDWERDATATVLAKLNCADGFPGVRDSLFGQACQLYNGGRFPALGQPGDLLGRAGEGVVRATADGAVWIGHCKRGGWHQVAGGGGLRRRRSGSAGN